MAIYVDAVALYPASKKYDRLWCHMATDGDIEELHKFAAKLGLQRRWFQNHPQHPHYDITQSKQTKAIRAGAILVTSEDLVRKCFQTKGRLEYERKSH